MEYGFTHVTTRDTVGYFDCLPEPAPDLESGLALLCQRPLDVFLYRYCLGLIAKTAIAELERLAEKNRSSAVWWQLVSELAASREDLRPLLERGASGTITRLSRAGSINAAGRQTQLREYAANVHQHASLPAHTARDASIRSCMDTLAAREGILAAKFAQTPPPEPDPPQDIKSLHERAERSLARLGITAGPVMRHEASLSPIALLREWNLECGVDSGPNAHRVTGIATAYGRGLSLAQAKVSCIMEIVERASAFTMVRDSCAYGHLLRKATCAELAGDKYLRPRLYGPEDIPLYWRHGENSKGEPVFVPAQAVYLFLNLDEPELCDSADSTGLGAGAKPEQAKLAALTEVLERYAHATTPFSSGACFQLASRDPVIQGLLDDYRWRGIHVQFQDITSELGLPCYRCFVKSINGEIAQATGASLSGRKAALAALTETPWPYYWSSGRPSPSARHPADLPVRFLEDLPDYSSGNNAADLKLLEDTLEACGLDPVYVDLSRQDLGLPVYRALAPGLEVDTDFETSTGVVFAARLAALERMNL